MRKLLLALGLLGALAGTAQAVIAVTTMGNANQTVSITDQRIITTTAFTAARTLTLPSAAGTCIGQTCPANALVIMDVANAINGAFSLTITPASGETINGSSSSLVLTGPGDRVELIPISGTNWFAQVFPAALQTETSLAQAWNAGRNLLDNGAMQVQQRGTGTRTCAQNAGITSAAYSADRWGCQANVASGAGQAAAVTNDQPTGFSGAQQLWRNTGALTQPVCMMQEIPTVKATSVAGQTVVLSFYAKALAGLAADNGNVITANIFTGTGSDQGLGTPTASPAITPAWTNIATVLAQSQTITTSWVRYTMAPITLASTVTEIAVALCFTPTASGAGATDGFEFTGVQLEKGAIASPYEFKGIAADVLEAQRYYWQVTEPAASVAIGASGQGASTTTCILSLALPVTMRAAPTYATAGTAISGSQWTITHVVTNTALSSLAATAGGSTVNRLNLTATTGAALTTGQTCTLTGAGGGNIITASADF